MLIFIAFLCVLVLFHSGFFCLLPSLSSPFFLVQSAQMHIHKNFHTNINTSIYLSMSISLYLYIERDTDIYISNISVCMEMPKFSLLSLPTFPMPAKSPAMKRGKGERQKPFPSSPQARLPAQLSLPLWLTDANLRQWFCSDGIWLPGTLHWYLCWLLCQPLGLLMG